MIHCREVFPEKFSDSSPIIVSLGNSLLIAVRKYSSTALSASVTSVLSALISTLSHAIETSQALDLPPQQQSILQIERRHCQLVLASLTTLLSNHLSNANHSKSMNLKHSPVSFGIISDGICLIYISTGSVNGIFAKIFLNEPKLRTLDVQLDKGQIRGLRSPLLITPRLYGKKIFQTTYSFCSIKIRYSDFCIICSYLSCVRNVPSGKITKASDPKSFARLRTPSTSRSLFLTLDLQTG